VRWKRKEMSEYTLKPVIKKGGKWNVVDIENTELFVHPPAAGDHWFKYNQNWYTLAVVDENGVEVVANTETVNIVITFVSTSGVDVLPVTVSTKPTRGMFWFKSLDLYLFGSVAMTFSSTSTFRGHRLKPLVINIPVVKDIYGRTYSESELVRRDKANDNVDSGISTLRKRSTVGNGETVSNRDIKNQKRACIEPFFVSECDDVLPMPLSSAFLSSRHRFERHRGTYTNDERKSSKPKPGGWSFDGPVLKLTLSSSLATTILDDQANVKSLLHFHEADFDIRVLEQTRSNAQRPTVNEMFLKLQDKMLHVPEIAKEIQHLRYCFEGMFENNVLFTEEKIVLKSKIDAIRLSRSKFGDNFGPYYFLRFIVFFALAAEASTHESSSSSLRGNALICRQGKSAFVRMQEIIDTALKDLDDGAHYYFG